MNRFVHRACLVRIFLPAGVLVTGCATFNKTQSEVTRALHDWQRPRAAWGEMRPAHQQSPPELGESKEVFSAEPARPIDQYVQQALRNNPGIQAAISDTQAKLRRIPQVTSLPDPTIRAAVRPEPIQTAAGDMYFTLGVNQTIPLLARLERAGNVAAAEARVALEQLNMRRQQLVADVETAFWQVYRIDRFLEITRENRQLIEDLRSVVETRYKVGGVPQQDLLRVDTELGKLRDDEFRLGKQRNAAAASLNQLRAQPAQSDVRQTTATPARDIAGDVDRVMALATDHNPSLAMLQRRIDQNQEQLELARLGYWPDISLGFEWNYLEGRDAYIPPLNITTGQRPPINRKSEVGDDNWALTFQVNLPIWSGRVQGAIHEARERLASSESELADARNKTAFRVFDAWSRIQASRHSLEVLNAELIPEARQAYEVTLIGYQSGNADFVTLIDAWRRWLEFELMRHRETANLETAFAELQREAGVQLIPDSDADASTGE
ncbi:MAG: TolC family protein [Phycisphaerae bacterium]|nr:TolC family protein [Phycisphaerae bacterium]